MRPVIKRNLQPTHSATCVKELPNRGKFEHLTKLLRSAGRNVKQPAQL